MKLSELYEMIAEDFPVDKTNLGDESLKTAKMFSKYIRIWSEEKLILEKLKNNRKSLCTTKREYYSGAAPASVYKEKPFDLKLKTDTIIQKYVDSDPDVTKYDEQIIIQMNKVEVLDNCLKEIKTRGYSIKNAIDMLKFEAGY
jgi:hypothetical protein